MILKSLSLCVLHELLQRYQSVSILVHLGGGGRREGGRKGEIYYLVIPYPRSTSPTPTSVRTCSLMRAISSWASIPCMSSPYAFFTCEWTPTLTYMASYTYLFNSTAVTNQILSPMLPHPPLHRRDLPAPFGQDGCRCLYLYKENEMSNSNQKSGSLLPT